MTNTMILRKIDDKTKTYLQNQAKKQGTSVNSLVLKIIKTSAGTMPPSTKKTRYDDLDRLAGTWSKKDLQEFNKNTDYFEKIDKDLW